jgi:hypothetical protein
MGEARGIGSIRDRRKGTGSMNEELKRVLDNNDLIIKLRDIIAAQDQIIMEYRAIVENLVGKPKENELPNG